MYTSYTLGELLQVKKELRMYLCRVGADAKSNKQLAEVQDEINSR